ncbi:helix-turn-helix transcriptional regulator [Methylosinus sp. Sm6]|uniref:S24 family peptidase n=1 Tax=Methylosinus sp. Sm6 TaxID=2866948 RepID=UPI00351D6F03
MRLATACGVSPEWLLTGYDARSGVVKQVPASMDARTDLVCIPVLDVDASAGPGAVGGASDVLDILPFPSATLRRLGVNPDLVEFIRARGDSMEPTIQSGALVLVDRSKREIREDGVYAFSIDGEIRIKRIRRNVGGSFTLLSDNKSLYPDETVSLADAQTLRIHGRVFWAERYV